MCEGRLPDCRRSKTPVLKIVTLTTPTGSLVGFPADRAHNHGRPPYIRHDARTVHGRARPQAGTLSKPRIGLAVSHHRRPLAPNTTNLPLNRLPFSGDAFHSYLAIDALRLFRIPLQVE